MSPLCGSGLNGLHGLSSAQQSSAGSEFLPYGPQVSEDHCWLNMSADGRREGTCEITTDNVPKRALAVEAAAWEGWLYSGGHAVLCSPQVRLLVALQLVNPMAVSSPWGVVWWRGAALSQSS